MLFSAIIPIFNAEKYLRECVDSVLRQTLRDYELILVDDGSIDRSGAICDEYAARDARIRVLHRENGGQASARNAGVASARGDYVVFLDSDDFFCTDDVFSSLAEAFAAGADVVVFKYFNYYSSERKRITPSLDGLSGLQKSELVRELVRRDAFFCSCWSKSVRRSLLTDGGVSFDESLCCEDMDWYYNVVTMAERIAAVDRAFVCYRRREDSVSSEADRRTVADYLTTLRRWRERFEAAHDGAYRDAMLSSLAKLYCNLLILFSRDREALGDLAGDIFSMKDLLAHRLNPRARRISVCAHLVGIENTCRLIGFADRIKNNK